MSLIKRAKRYLILASVAMTIILIFLCYISSSFSYIVDHKRTNNNKYLQANKIYVQQPTITEKNTILKSKGDNSMEKNSSSIILSMKEYKNLLADVAKNRKMLIDSIWSKTMQNAKELNRQKNDLDTKLKLIELTNKKFATLITFASTDVPNLKENKDDRSIQSQNKEDFSNTKINDNSKSQISNNGGENHNSFQKKENNLMNQEKQMNSLPAMGKINADIQQEEGRGSDKTMEKQRLQGSHQERGNNHYKYGVKEYARHPETVYRRINMKSTKTEDEHKGDKFINRSKISDFQRQGKVLNELKKLALGQTSRFASVQGGSNKGIQQSENSDNKLRMDDCKSCTHNNFRYMINQKFLCTNKADIDVLFVILTAPDEFIQRSMIRETWGTECTKTNIACMFILGNVFNTEINDKLVQESKEFHDIVQFDFKEAYANLTYKTLSGLRWASEFCPAAKYIMKTDGDMFVNTELIPKMLQAAPDKGFLGGYCWGLSSPHREPESKWYVSFNSYSKSKFPPMCSGTGYIMSRDVLEGILIKSHGIPFFHLEDVYIALCSQKLSVKPVNLQGFSNLRQSFSPCSYRNSVMTSHYLPPDVLKEYWSESRKCALEYQEPDRLYKNIPYPQVS